MVWSAELVADLACVSGPLNKVLFVDSLACLWVQKVDVRSIEGQQQALEQPPSDVPLALPLGGPVGLSQQCGGISVRGNPVGEAGAADS